MEEFVNKIMCKGCKNHGTSELQIADKSIKRESCLIYGDIDKNTKCSKRDRIKLNSKIKKIKQ